MIYRAKYDGLHEMKGKTEARFVIAGETAARTGINLIYPPGLHRELVVGETIYVARVGNNSSDYILIGVEQDTRADVQLENDESSITVKEDGKIEIGGSDSGGLLIWAELEKQLQAVSDYLQGIADALSNAATGAQDGGAVFKTNILLKLKTLKLPDYSKIESDTVLHGVGGGSEGNQPATIGPPAKDKAVAKNQAQAEREILQDIIAFVDKRLKEEKDPLIDFEHPEEVAIHWGRRYLAMSRKYDLEFGSTIYKRYNAEGKLRYIYTKPTVGIVYTVWPSWPVSASQKDVVAFIHTHGAHTDGFLDEQFSDISPKDSKTGRRDGDIPYAIGKGIDAYLVTPSGLVKKYNHKTGQVSTLIDIDLNIDP